MTFEEDFRHEYNAAWDEQLGHITPELLLDYLRAGGWACIRSLEEPARQVWVLREADAAKRVIVIPTDLSTEGERVTLRHAIQMLMAIEQWPVGLSVTFDYSLPVGLRKEEP